MKSTLWSSMIILQIVFSTAQVHPIFLFHKTSETISYFSKTVFPMGELRCRLNVIWAQCCIITFASFLTCAINPFGDNKIDYASSTEDMKVLIKHEYKIFKILTALAEKSERKLNTVTSYISDFSSSLLQGIGAERSLITFEKVSLMDGDTLAEEVVNHALMTFRCIRRIVRNLPEIHEELNVISPKDNLREKLKELTNDIPYPVNEDLETAISAVIRLKQIYDINIDNIVIGKIGNLHTNSGLTARQCYEIGLYAFHNDWYSQAIDFLNKALEMESDKHFPFTALEIEDLETKLTQMITEHENKLRNGLEDRDYMYDTLPYIFQDYLNDRNSSSFQNRMSLSIDPKMEAQETPIALISKFQKLCRDQNFPDKGTKGNKLKCYLRADTHPYWTISPLKVEVHHEDPLVVQIYDVLTELEMTDLKSEVKSELRRSRTVALSGDTKGETSPYRTSSNSWILDFNITKFQYLGKKVGRMVNFDLSQYEASENLQIANYPPGSHYVSHLDAIFDKEVLPNIDISEIRRGDRIATFMTYLSNVEAGGYTVFPRLKIAVKPIKGSAVFWYNLFADGSINDKMLHAGCPVLYGQKWIANKWIRSNDQMFLRKCPLVFQFDNLNLKL